MGIAAGAAAVAVEAARRIGVDIGRLSFVAYGYLGFCAALGGMVQAHRVGESVPNAMVNTELAVLSAAVLGEHPTNLQLIGAGVVIVSVAVANGLLAALKAKAKGRTY